MLGVCEGREAVGVLCIWLPVHYPWCVVEGEFASACSNRKRHYVQASFPCVFFCLLIMHVCSNNLALCVKYNRSDKWSTTQGTAVGTKPPGTARDLIWFLSTPSKRVTARSRKWEGDITPVSCVRFPLTGGAWRDHDCKPQCAHVSSYGENGLRFLLSVWIETQRQRALGMTVRGHQALSWHDRLRPAGQITSGSRQTHLLWMCLPSACVNV